MTTPVAADLLRAWVSRALMLTAGVALGLMLSTGTAQADSPLDLGKTADKVVESVRTTTSSVAKSPVKKSRKVVHRVTKPVRQVTSSVPRVSKPVQRTTKSVRHVAKPVRHVTKHVRHTVHRDKTGPKHEATKPKPSVEKTTTAKREATTTRAAKAAKAAKRVKSTVAPHRATTDAPTPAKPVLSSTVTRTTTLTGALASDVSTGLVTTDTTLTEATTPLVTGLTRQLPTSVRTVVDNEVLSPVSALHDTAVALVADTLVVTVPTVVDRVATPVLPVLDRVEGSLPATPGVPESPITPPLVSAPIQAAPVVLGGPSSPAGPAAESARGTSVGAAGPRAHTSGPALLFGPDQTSDPTVARAHLPAATTATAVGAGLLGAFDDAIDHASFGVGPSGSASATGLALLLLALASSAGVFGAGARSLRVLGPLHQGPFRRAHRPGFSPD